MNSNNIITRESIESILYSNSFYKENIPGVSISVINNNNNTNDNNKNNEYNNNNNNNNNDNYIIDNYAIGLARFLTNEYMTEHHYLQCASLSKTIAAAFSIDYFNKRNISMTTSVNALLRSIHSQWIITSSSSSSSSSNSSHCTYDPEEVTLSMLINHTALGMHYVYGIPFTQSLTLQPLQLLDGTYSHIGYKPLVLDRHPGVRFSYSGGGFVVLQYLLETMEGKSIDEMTREYLDGCGLHEFTFTQSKAISSSSSVLIAYGHKSLQEEVIPLVFPPLAAGALCPSSSLASFLVHLTTAYHNKNDGSGSISYNVARQMLGEDSMIDLGAFDFMGAQVAYDDTLLSIIYLSSIYHLSIMT